MLYGESYPEGAILHYDAEVAPLTELTGGPSTFNSSILGPQYRRNADGSYSVTDYNLIPNSEAVGASVGVLPTGWVKGDSNGVVVSVVGAGIGYVDVSFVGTAVGIAYPFILSASNTAIVASPGETWTGSFPFDVISGSLSVLKVSLRWMTATGSGVRSIYGHEMSSSPITGTAPELTERVTVGIVLTIPSGSSVNVTIRISRPQLTKSSTQLPYKPTYGTSVATPAVDTLEDGFVGLRSCGAVTNLLATGKEDFTTWTIAASAAITKVSNIYRYSITATTSRYFQTTITVNAGSVYTIILRAAAISSSTKITTQVIGGSTQTLPELTLNNTVTDLIWSFTASASEVVVIRMYDSSGSIGDRAYLYRSIITATSYPVPYVPPGVTQPASNATSTGGNWFTNPDGSPLWKSLDGEPDGVEKITNGTFENATGWIFQTGWSVDSGKLKVNAGASTYLNATINCPVVAGERYLISFDIKLSQGGLKIRTTGGSDVDLYIWSTPFVGKYRAIHSITANATGFRFHYTTGSTIAEIDNISIQRIQPQPITLATRIKMGVGSGDLPNSSTLNIIGINTDIDITKSLTYARKSTNGATLTIIHATDGANYASKVSSWSSNAVIQRFVQVNTAGTRFRVGYMIEGTHTTIQWSHTGDSSTWAAYDGSFNPSTLYRLMIGYNNPYPMWLNKLAVWKRQVSDAELLEVFS